MAKFNIAQINLCTEAEGPGRRLAIWFQGCDQNCPNCCNPLMRSITVANIMCLEELSNLILYSKKKYDIEGVTYIGGEPTLQSALPLLTHNIKVMGLGIIAFTGHIYEDVKNVLRECDLVIDGPYLESQKSSSRRIIGSDNQRLLFITKRYLNFESWFYSNITAGDINLTDSSMVYNGNYQSELDVGQ